MEPLLSNIHTPDHLELLARQVVEGFIIGLHKSPFHGFSVEFAEHRLYNQGEPTKNLDWKVLARTDKMFVKRYEEETNLRCQLVIDASSSMYYPMDAREGMNKLRFSVYCAAALINLLKRQRDAAGLSVFADAVKLNTGARSTTKHLQLLYAQLEQLLQAPPLNTTTNAAACLHEIADTVHRRSMVILFSDMFDQAGGAKTDELFQALQHLRFNKHEVIVFHVTDKKHELDFEFENRPYVFVDMETGEKVKLQTNQVREHYLTQISAYKKELMLRCGQYHIEFIEADINEGFHPVLQAFLMKRKKLK